MNRKWIGMGILAGFLAGGFLLSSCKKNSGSPEGHQEGGPHSQQMRAAEKYTCPMHPEVISEDKNARCPKCNMFLVPVEEMDKDMEAEDHSAHQHSMHRSAPEEKSSGPLYHCPMHPTFTSGRPGECGICGMDLVPVEIGDEKESGLDGQATVKITERRQQLIGVKFGDVKKRPILETIRTVGRVAYDPELYRTQEEYLGALSAYERVKSSSLPEAIERAASLVKSSELRLRLLGLSDRQIQELRRRSGPDTSLLLSSGKTGRVWLYLDIYEYELPIVKAGQKIEANTVSLPGRIFKGTVKAIDPVINPKTRSARVRAEIFNENGLLKPDMYLNATIKIDLGKKLTVPEEAVMDTGKRRIVFVNEGGGFFEPREVLLGDKSEHYYEVKSGLTDGEEVVTSGNFLIDSESKLKSALSALAGGHQH